MVVGLSQIERALPITGFDIYIRAGGEQHFQRSRVARVGGGVQRRVAAVLGSVNRRAGGEQQSDDSGMPAGGRGVDRGSPER